MLAGPRRVLTPAPMTRPRKSACKFLGRPKGRTAPVGYILPTQERQNAMRHMRLAIVLFGLTAGIWAADPAIGTWKLNVEKSKYEPGPPPKSATVSYEENEGGIKRTGETVNADGQTVSFQYAAKYDGKDYPVTGNPNADMISLKRLNDRTVEATLKKGGKPVTTVRRVVSRDGKTMTSLSSRRPR
jgi:hypothetical protein